MITRVGSVALTLAVLSFGAATRARAELFDDGRVPNIGAVRDVTPPPRLADFVDGKAQWVLDIADVGLPVGESHTLVGADGVLRSYLHASTDSAGVLDRKGGVVAFPGCVTVWESRDRGRSFQVRPRCLFDEHAEQQQYPRVAQAAGGTLYLAYEWDAQTMLRVSRDGGATWSGESRVPGTGEYPGACPALATVGACSPVDFYNETPAGACLVGAPPGIFIDGDELFVFAELGSCPAHLTCFRGPRDQGAAGLRRCDTTALLSGSPSNEGAADFDHRFLSSADVVREGGRYYMLFEGERGPTLQSAESGFGLGFAWSDALDAEWTRYPGNPILTPFPGNIGVGHGDLVQIDGVWFLYTATSDSTRGRYRLQFNDGSGVGAFASRLHGTVTVDGFPREGVLVTAWGQAGGDWHQTFTDAAGIYEFVRLDPASRYNVGANSRFSADALSAADVNESFALRDNVVLIAGPDGWHGEDFPLASAAAARRR